jgi:hypothetical protein
METFKPRCDETLSLEEADSCVGTLEAEGEWSRIRMMWGDDIDLKD